MILSGLEIKKRLGREIFIEPYDERYLNPNSYNLRLYNELLVYEEPVLDMKKPNKTKILIIPEEGLVLEPGRLYLGRTVEYTKTEGYVPMLEGRSSIGRLGLYVHVTAGFGDVGFSGYWTLEIQCVQPVRIYPGVEICQIYYHSIQGEYENYCSGKYQNNTGIQPSLLYRDFEKKSATDIKITVTDSKNSDFASLRALLDKDLGKRYGELQKEYEKHNKVDYIKDVVIIYKNSEAVACGAFKEYDSQSVEIKRVFVKEEHRRQGLSGKVMEKLEELARNQGYRYAVLETGVRQTEAIGLYKSLGYEMIPNYGPYAGNDNSVCMKKQL